MKPAQLIAIILGVIACLWLLARVCIGAANLRDELHDLGLD